MTIAAIRGMAGVGKSALAVHLAHRFAASYPDAQVYVDLGGFGGDHMDTASALKTIILSLGVSSSAIPDDPVGRTGLYRSLLATRRTLLVLDNARDTAHVRDLLAGGPGSIIVVTSRDSLAGMSAEYGAYLEVLDMPPPARAHEMMVRRIGSRRCTPESAAVHELVELCGRLPLALAIVSAYAATRPQLRLSALVDDLKSARRPLDPFEEIAGPCGVRSKFADSYELLSDPAARLFRSMSMQQGSLALEDCARLAGTNIFAARSLVAELRDVALICEETDGNYSLHDLIRAYGMEQHEASESVQ